MNKVKVFAAVIIIFAFISMGAEELPKVFPEFSSLDIDAQPVSSDMFKENKLTMVNMWTTWCPPCIGEMPDLGNMGRSMPDGTQLIGIVLDADGPGDSGTVGEAKRILSVAKADFLQIFPSRQMESVLRCVEAIPTTIFVDSQGNIVGEPMAGARDEVEKLLKSIQ